LAKKRSEFADSSSTVCWASMDVANYLMVVRLVYLFQSLAYFDDWFPHVQINFHEARGSLCPPIASPLSAKAYAHLRGTYDNDYRGQYSSDDRKRHV
jgi:hypothetical protein